MLCPCLYTVNGLDSRLQTINLKFIDQILTQSGINDPALAEAWQQKLKQDLICGEGSWMDGSSVFFSRRNTEELKRPTKPREHKHSRNPNGPEGVRPDLLSPPQSRLMSAVTVYRRIPQISSNWGVGGHQSHDKLFLISHLLQSCGRSLIRPLQRANRSRVCFQRSGSFTAGK